MYIDKDENGIKFVKIKESNEDMRFGENDLLRVEINEWVAYDSEGNCYTPHEPHYCLSVKTPYNKGQFLYKLIFSTFSKDKFIEYVKGLVNSLDEICDKLEEGSNGQDD